MEKNIEDLEKARTEHQLRAVKALQTGDESTARRALSEKMKSHERIEQLTPVLESRRETYDELKEALVEIHDQLNQARSKLMDLRARKRAAEAEQVLGSKLDNVRNSEDPGFERLEDSVVEAESRSEVEREVRGDILPKPLERSYREKQVEEELKSLQAKLSQPTAGE